MVKPASLPRISGPITCLALLLSSLPTIAQEAKKLPDGKEQSEEAVFIPIEYRPPPYQVSVGVRLSGKAKVKFSSLGYIPERSVPGEATGVKSRSYDNGYVDTDISRDSAGNRIDVTDGMTNSWAYASSSQLNDSTVPNATSVAFQTNSIESSGATASSSSGSSSAWDIEISRQLGGNKRITWGITIGAGLSDFNAKTSATIKANLRTITDTYTVNGSDPRLTITTPATDTTPSATNYKDSYRASGPLQWVQSYDTETKLLLFNTDGTPMMVQFGGTPTYPDGQVGHVEWIDDSVRLSDSFVRNTSVSEIDVTGQWQVKGAFITTRFGPYVACQLGRHFVVRASAGFTFTVMGAKYRFSENYYHPYLAVNMPLVRDENSSEHTVAGTLGYFLSGELNWFMSQRTGLFVGAIHESYARNLRIKFPGLSQTADIAASSGTGFRTGITTRF